jgi:hypothetical protein
VQAILVTFDIVTRKGSENKFVVAVKCLVVNELKIQPHIILCNLRNTLTSSPARTRNYRDGVTLRFYESVKRDYNRRRLACFVLKIPPQ